MSRRERAPLVLVAWVDASLVTSRWMDRAEAIKDGIRYSADPILACGFLIAERKDVVVLSLTFNHHNDDVSNVMAIPTKAIVSITHLRGVKGAKMPKAIEEMCPVHTNPCACYCHSSRIHQRLATDAEVQAAMEQAYGKPTQASDSPEKP